jgi:tetratricopeptide (TPR) repeat protein
MHYMIRRFNLNDLRVLGELALAACDATDYSSRAPALAAFATIERRSGDIETARLRYQESIDAWRQSGDLTGLAAALNGLGLLEHAAGNLDDAMRLFRACREVLSQTGDLRMERFLLTNVSEVLAEQGRHREVIDVVRTALRSARRDPSQGFKMVAFEVLGRSYAQVGEPARALRCFGRSLRLATSIDDVYLRRNALLGRAATYLRLNRPDLTIEDAERVRGEAAETGDVYRHAASLRLLCQAFILIGPPDLAKLYRRQAELLFKRLDRPYERQVEAFLAGDDLTLPRPT